jgi:endonuclease/exonuclease/phosphatase family metal-dependent hydrolase
MAIRLSKLHHARRLFYALAFTGIGAVARWYAHHPRGLEKEEELEIRFTGNCPTADAAESGPFFPLRILTLNLAHGRKDGKHQVLQRKGTIQGNLDDVAALLRDVRPHVVALQEADGPSLWSGSFDHVRYLAEKAGYPYAVLGEHVKRRRTSYGTAILSRLPLKTSRSVTFAPSPPTFPKGVVLATVVLPGIPEREVDVLSIHLDFARPGTRKRQADALAQKLLAGKGPFIVMGDFNCEWLEREETLRDFAGRTGLMTFRPWDWTIRTFPKSMRRLDWIFASPCFSFENHAILTDPVSDHFAVYGELGVSRWCGREEAPDPAGRAGRAGMPAESLS